MADVSIKENPSARGGHASFPFSFPLPFSFSFSFPFLATQRKPPRLSTPQGNTPAPAPKTASPTPTLGVAECCACQQKYATEPCACHGNATIRTAPQRERTFSCPLCLCLCFLAFPILPFPWRYSSLSFPFHISALPFPSFPVALQFTCWEMFRHPEVRSETLIYNI